MKASFTVFIICIAILNHLTHGWWFDDDHTPRPRDGTLRCYQCNSTEEKETKEPLCHLENWKHANVTEKRNMIMQCPRRKSAFCHLVLDYQNKTTVRGCSGPTYDNNNPAHTGCFSMDAADLSRACLCDSNLCNLAASPTSSYYTVFLVLYCHLMVFLLLLK